MKRKRIFFLVVNYIQISLSLLFVGWVYGYKRTPLIEDDEFIGLVVFLMLIVFIANSLKNIFSVKDLNSQKNGSKMLTVASSVLAFLFIISVGLMVLFGSIAVYTFFMIKTAVVRNPWGEIAAAMLSSISLIVLVNQYWFRKRLKKLHREKLESEINIIGSESSAHE